MPSVAWQPWHTAAFLDAQHRRRPVVLLLETAWAPACAQAHAAVFSRPDVQQAIAEATVPVRVDADRRPDIGDRYGLGHWPSLLFLTPEGHVLTGGTALDDALAARVRAVAAAFAAGDGAWAPSAPAELAEPADFAYAGDADDARLLTALAASVWQARDAVHGVFMHEGLPSPTAVTFAFAHGLATGDADWMDAAQRTLEALAGAVPDLDTTGLAACVPAAAGGPPVVRLEDQADWIRAHARALHVTAESRGRDRLRRLVAALVRDFRRHDGHFRAWTSAPGLVLVDASARACGSLLAAADALEEPDMARTAIDALEVLAPAAYARAAGVAHVIDGGRARGPMLLDDAMLLAHALADADRWRADDVYRDLADELLRTTTARLQDGSGMLVDRIAALAGAGRVGRLAEPHYPIVGNAEAARLLVRLHPDDAAACDDARRLLVSMSPRATGAGVFAAPAALAWHALGPPGSAAAAW